MSVAEYIYVVYNPSLYKAAFPTEFSGNYGLWLLHSENCRNVQVVFIFSDIDSIFLKKIFVFVIMFGLSL